VGLITPAPKGHEAYPRPGAERTSWIMARRGRRNDVSPDRPYAFFTERERTVSGQIADVATIFLTNRECPWKCAMCDLWRNTTLESVEPGAIPRQIEFALAQLPAASVIKLYNSGSFFDSRAIPKSDWPSIARLCSRFEHVVVECHPLLINDSVLEFASLLQGTFEVALGLETCHPAALESLNKRINLADYERAAKFLIGASIGLRTFLLIQPPFIPRDEQSSWLKRSMDYALDCGSSVVSLIPTRTGNGALETLEELGLFSEPSITDLEQALEYGINLQRQRIFGDTWDLQRFSKCPVCLRGRIDRIQEMNLTQRMAEPIHCPDCLIIQ
jgi:radical SAM enzyme (TIGR01210 family)